MQKLLSSVDRRNFLLASAFGFGLSPILPGTCAALWGLAIYLFILYLTPLAWHFPLLLSCFLVVSFFCLYLNTWAEKYFEDHDSSAFVLDEIAGYLFVPLIYPNMGNLEFALWAFVLFRIFDMIKIFPADIIDKKWNNRWGVLCDDLMSAFYAMLVLYISFNIFVSHTTFSIFLLSFMIIILSSLIKRKLK
ncbi:phosphatidylglycerophosphatase A family protein [Desulfovibrio litoralis]|uniref:Phosphatidylglycerophosphatase A n=1 Tax=Desulfovibrio litoralis DSM 11393 TaxID=1121455 RepID=A0A1M7TJC6_9BACT|nr:phosphatidylglycerophosphatase A [Desulfovibrio litoralis]SHN70820.1 phosphatidylglycerophosphatase A [Desulfovibrio litoralis DSM 11393]